MEISAPAALWFLPPALPVCLWVAWSDMKAMKIPNRAVVVLFLVFCVTGLIALPLADIVWRLVQVAGVLAAGFLLSAAGVVGAGDAKFTAAAAAFVAPDDAGPVLMLFALVLLAAFATHRAARALPWVRRHFAAWQSWHHADFPMGLALGGTLAFYLSLGALRQLT